MKKIKRIIRDILRLSIDSVILLESFLYRKQRPIFVKNAPIRRILIMRKDGLGDCIIFYPTLKAYREFYNNDEITLIFPICFESLYPILSRDLVDKVIWFDHKKFGSSFSYRRKFLLDLKRSGYDIAIYPVFSRETIGFFMMKVTGTKEIIGFDGDISGHGKLSEKIGTLRYTKLIKPPEEMKSELARDIYFAETVTGKKMSIDFPTIDTAKLPRIDFERYTQENNLTEKKYAVIFPGAGANYRIWQKEKFAEVINHIQKNNIIAVICGSPREVNLADDIKSLCNMSKNIVDLSGKTDLPTLVHLLKKSKFYFGSDTGILHLAAAIGVPTVGIMGMGGLDRFFPYGDLKKNRIIRDEKNQYETGNWTDTTSLKPGEIHPSISNITVEDAKKEIDFIINNL